MAATGTICRANHGQPLNRSAVPLSRNRRAKPSGTYDALNATKHVPPYQEEEVGNTYLWGRVPVWDELQQTFRFRSVKAALVFAGLGIPKRLTLMNSPAQDHCPGCGVQIPEACVRCRDCGAFLNRKAEKLASKQAADSSRPDWMVYYDGHQFGPFSVDDLRRAFSAKTTTVPREAIVWKHGFEQWVPAHSVPELWETVPRG